MRKRTRSRELALQFLYLFDLRGEEVLGELEAFVKGETEDAQIIAYACSLVRGVIDHLSRIDELIREAALNWDLERIAVVDRNIIRIACYEMVFTEEIPPGVAINEAIEISKKFSTAQSGSFVNGILDRIRIDRLEAEGREKNEKGTP